MKKLSLTLPFLFFVMFSCSEKKLEGEGEVKDVKEESATFLKISLPDIDNSDKEKIGYELLRGSTKTIAAFEMLNDSMFIVADNFHENFKIFKIEANKEIKFYKSYSYTSKLNKISGITYHKGLFLVHQENGTASTILDSNFQITKQLQVKGDGSLISFCKKDVTQMYVYLGYISNTSDGSGSKFKLLDPIKNTSSTIEEAVFDKESCLNERTNKETLEIINQKKEGIYSDTHKIAINKLLDTDEIIYCKYYNNKFVGLGMNYYSGKVYFLSTDEKNIPLAEEMKPEDCN